MFYLKKGAEPIRASLQPENVNLRQYALDLFETCRECAHELLVAGAKSTNPEAIRKRYPNVEILRGADRT